MAWFSLSPELTLKKVNSKAGIKKDLKDTFDKLPDKSETLLAVADDDWSGKPNDPWVIKINTKNYNWITTKSPIWAGGGKFTDSKKLYTVVGGNDITIRWRKTKVAYSLPSTQMQELGSAWVLERAVNDNKTTFKRVQDIIDDKVTYDKLVKIFRGDVPETWLYTFFAQQKKLFHHYAGNSPYETFNRDGGFMDFITKTINDKYGIDKKDTWNPADIWIIKGKQAKMENEIEDLVSGPEQQIQELNDYLKVKYRKGEIRGLSLKKISGLKAKFEVVNLGPKEGYVDTKDFNYPCDPSCFQSKFDIKTGKKNFTQDVRFVIKTGGRKRKTYDFQIKANSPELENGSNLKFEATQKGAGGARMGKAPVDKIIELLHYFGEKDFVNDYGKYPANRDEFQKHPKKGKTYFKKVIRDLLSGSKKMKSDMTNVNKIIDNIDISFDSPDDRDTNTRCKLMGLDFFYSVKKLGEDNMREFATDMVYLSQKKSTKKNNKFGPFGKVY